MSYHRAETERRLATLIRLGRVQAVDYAAARVRLRVGDLLTGWVPWVERRAGGNRSWAAPEIGEQMILLAPGGDTAQGVALGAVYQDAHPAPAASAEIHRIDWGDGSFVEFDRAAGRLRLSCTGDIEIAAGGNVRITGQRIDLN